MKSSFLSSLHGHQPSGTHILADLHGVDPTLLSHQNAIETLLLQSAKAAGAHAITSYFHSFGNGLGITGVVLLAESHISIHTWPESSFAALDIFMCGEADAQCALTELQKAFQPISSHVQVLSRGRETLNK